MASFRAGPFCSRRRLMCTALVKRVTGSVLGPAGAVGRHDREPPCFHQCQNSAAFARILAESNGLGVNCDQSFQSQDITGPPEALAHRPSCWGILAVSLPMVRNLVDNGQKIA